MRAEGLAIALALLLLPAAARPSAAADSLAQRVWARSASEGRVGTMHFELVAASGAVRRRQALMLHSDRPDAVRLAIFFQQPASIASTAFLSHDHRAKADETWLFLPATERVRRIPASQRADAFLGTDLSFGDLKDGFRFAPEDWVFEGGETRSFRGRPHLWLAGRARSPAIARETGYGAFRALICPDTLFPMLTDYDDREGKPVKRVEIHETARIGGTWTAIRFTATNQRTGHRTAVHFTGMRHVQGLGTALFSPDRLADGAPRIP